MSQSDSFLTSEAETAIVEAIRLAELQTSGEIRVHLEKSTSKVPFDRALEVFHSLNMHATAQKNGVLIYVAYQDKNFVICGDQGINDLVPADFWDTTKDLMASHFKSGDFAAGLVSGIAQVGEQLKTYFPLQENDQNELSNEISKG
jgi:uncharacterized membrane protein